MTVVQAAAFAAVACCCCTAAADAEHVARVSIGSASEGQEYRGIGGISGGGATSAYGLLICSALASGVREVERCLARRRSVCSSSAEARRGMLAYRDCRRTIRMNI